MVEIAPPNVTDGQISMVWHKDYNWASSLDPTGPHGL